MTKAGFVYCIGREFHTVKIGYSADPQSRLVRLQAGNPLRVEIIGKIPGDYKTERSLHEQFAHLKMAGEWFRDEAGVISAYFAEAFGQRLGRPGRVPRNAPFRASFGEDWARFINDNFANSTEAAAHFGVDDRTVRGWLNLSTEPRGWVVAYAVATMPVQSRQIVRAA